MALAVLVLAAPAVSRADCSGGAEQVQYGCGKVGWAGCCDGEILRFCEGGGLCEKDCSGALHCGYNKDKGFYDCGTDGQGDPSGTFPLACPPDDLCQGVDYAGCCAGDVAWWCEGNALKSLDCGANGTLSVCGFNGEKKVADCLDAEAAAAPSCPFAPGADVGTGGDVVAPDGGGPTDSGAGAGDAWPSVDGVTVPDVNAPSSCVTLGVRYAVSSTDCSLFASRVSVKQEGCAAVWVGLVPTALSDPAGFVTQSGVAFSFTDTGLDRSCTGQISGDTITGSCSWTGDGACAFTLDRAPDPVSPGTDSGSSGGCSVGLAPRPQVLLSVFFVVLALCLVSIYYRGARR
jgi:hypothetical protein